MLAGAAGLPLCRAAFGQRSPSAIAATKLTDNLTMITGAGANVMVVIADDGLLMVDGGLPDRSAELLKVVAEQGGRAKRASVVQYALAPGPHRLERSAGQGWREDHGEPEYEALAEHDGARGGAEPHLPTAASGSDSNGGDHRAGKLTFGRKRPSNTGHLPPGAHQRRYLCVLSRREYSDGER